MKFPTHTTRELVEKHDDIVDALRFETDEKRVAILKDGLVRVVFALMERGVTL
jgi:hypothetical protein